ncbi:MAG: molybdenum cofactor biosynthesis protein MoaE [Deltaproteobacteria bacterium]|nr:molybdenum cofactor biosynthesis protein MoaE [Candidatus Anaeroferrophillus wilburensis]MBN2888764.1 molybdenum cofactor biosynthesis protein MoaE [Deltaproteobacteria bacterium]
MTVSVNTCCTDQPFDLQISYQQFLAREPETTGTVVFHHGKVKYPGKQVPRFRDVLLAPVVADPAAALELIGRQAAETFDLHQVLIVHRQGVVQAGDDVLLVIVSAATRKPAFDACAWIVDQIKQEMIITLRERT